LKGSGPALLVRKGRGLSPPAIVLSETAGA